jgi:hypothetical protein
MSDETGKTVTDAVPVAVPRDLSVIETATLVGVSRARVYQRITGKPALGAGRPLPVTVSGGVQRVPIIEAMNWRMDRLAEGLPVGPLPDWATVWSEQIARDAKSRGDRVARVVGIGMPGVIGVPTVEDAP